MPKWSRLIIDIDNINTNYTSIEIEKMRIPMHKKYGVFWFFNVYVLYLFTEEKQKGKGG